MDLPFVQIGWWLSLKVTQCQDLPSMKCHDSSSGKICFTIFLGKNGHLLRMPFNEASRWCKSRVPGSSLIAINNVDSQRTVESFIASQMLENESIIIDARMLAPSKNPNWSWVNDHPYVPGTLEGTLLQLNSLKFAHF